MSLKKVTVILVGEYVACGNEFVQIDGLSIGVDMVISCLVEAVEE